MEKIQRLNVVLVRAENPVNIGQTARAMKNFGTRNLSLVNCVPHQVDEAYTPGWKAKDILDSAKTHSELRKAFTESSYVIGLTARIRNKRGGPAFFSELIPQILDMMQGKDVYLVFGNEKNGLSNEELDECDVAATIPTSLDYQSMNLSHAVAVCLYEIYSKFPESKKIFGWRDRYFATDAEFKDLMNDFSQVMNILEYSKSMGGARFKKIEAQISNFFRKARIEKREVNLFRAFLSKIQTRLKTESLNGKAVKSKNL